MSAYQRVTSKTDTEKICVTSANWSWNANRVRLDRLESRSWCRNTIWSHSQSCGFKAATGKPQIVTDPTVTSPKCVELLNEEEQDEARTGIQPTMRPRNRDDARSRIPANWARWVVSGSLENFSDLCFFWMFLTQAQLLQALLSTVDLLVWKRYKFFLVRLDQPEKWWKLEIND